VLVPIKAQAGYLQGAQQPEYIERIYQPFGFQDLNNGTYRAFEVSGYSMLADRAGFYPGDIVVGEYVETIGRYQRWLCLYPGKQCPGG
jgi:hypothetical protein